MEWILASDIFSVPLSIKQMFGERKFQAKNTAQRKDSSEEGMVTHSSILFFFFF